MQVANEVETEQILDAGIDYRTGLPLISSLVQVRPMKLLLDAGRSPISVLSDSLHQGVT